MASTSRTRRPRRTRRYAAIGALGLLALLVLIQLVPYGRDHANPPATKQVALAASAQREIFGNSCQDCHSNHTEWLWYTNVAPVSWLVQSDVDGGREHLNLSTWDKAQPGLDEVVQQIQSGEMPPLKYWISPYHRSARLSDTQKRQLIAGFRALYRRDPPPVQHRRGGD
jgi:heme-binding protein